MRIKILLSLLFLSLLVPSLGNVEAANTGKYLIILQSGMETKEGSSRALHALLYAKELKEHHHDVVLIFDGAGVEWVYEWANANSKNKLTPLFQEVRKSAVTWVLCDTCATAFEVRKDLGVRDVPLVSEYEGHPSIAQWADQGYEIIVL